MHLSVGQKVAYPNQGVCVVEEIEERVVAERQINGYHLRVLGDNSTIFVPADNASSVGIRPLISLAQCRKLIDWLSEDFEPVSADWKTRSREFMIKLQSGDVFEAADVLKKLTFLSHEKKLSFREQTLLEKARFLIFSEIENAYPSARRPRKSEIIDLVAGRTQAASAGTPPLMPHVKAGKLKLLAVGSPRRHPAYPDVPTVAEVVGAEFDADTVFGIYAPAGTPKDVVARLNQEISKAMQSPELKARAAAIAAQELVMPVDAFTARLRAEHERMSTLVREIGLKAD